MGKRRANGEGSIYKTKDRKLPDGKVIEGRWRFSLLYDGERYYGSATKRSDIVARLQALREQLGNGTFAGRSTETVEVMVNAWLDGHVKAHKGESTKILWEAVAKSYIYPRLGDKQLRQLRRKQVQKFVDDMKNENCPGRMRQLALSVLRKAVRHAIRMEKMTINPTDLVDSPEHEPEEIFPFNADEAARIMQASKGTRDHALIVLGLSVGMRIGELLGLPWSEVDLQTKELHVKQQAALTRGRVSIRKPKTKASVRTIALPACAVVALQRHQAIMMKEGNAGNELVFPAINGNVAHRTNFAARVWGPLLKALKLDPRGFHHTRHTYATLALKSGVPANVVAKVMGHAKPSTTMNIYGHVLKGQQSQSTDAIDQIFADAAKLLPSPDAPRLKFSGG